MGTLVWAGTFLLLIIVSSLVAAAAMIGMPIAGGVQLGVACMTLLLIWWGYELLAVAPRAPIRLDPAIV